VTDLAKQLFQDLSSESGEFHLGEGQITVIDDCNRLYVTYNSGIVSAEPVRTTLELGHYGRSVVGLNVILAIPKSNGTSPIILGVVTEAVVPPHKANDASNDIDESDDIVLEAVNSLSLKCGTSEIVIRRNGEVVIRGTKIVSRAAQSNKIKGATVLIN